MNAGHIIYNLKTIIMHYIYLFIYSSVIQFIC